MKQGLYILLALVLIVGIISITSKNNNNSSNPEHTFATESSWLLSPTGKYGLSLEKCMDDGVESYRIIVCPYEVEHFTIKAERVFRCRDTLLVLWDDTVDRIWAYSGDFGTFYWDIVDYELVINQYAHANNEIVPDDLKIAKPKIYS